MQQEDNGPVCLADHFNRITDEMIANEKAIVYSPNMPIKSMFEILDKQAKLINLRNWINILANQYDKKPDPLIQTPPGAANGMRIIH